MIGKRYEAARGENIDASSGPGRFRTAFSRADQALAESVGTNGRRQRA